MDPYNWTCDNIQVSSRNDYLGNPMPLGNYQYTGVNYGGYNGSLFNTNMTYTADANGVNYSYSNKPSKLDIGLGVVGAIGNIFGSIAAGRAAVKQQEAIQEQQKNQYLAYKEYSERVWSAQQQQLQGQQSQQGMCDMLNMMMMMKMMEKMDV